MYPLEPIQLQILLILGFQRWVSTEGLADVLWPVTGNRPTNILNSINKNVSQLRKKLRPYGYNLELRSGILRLVFYDEPKKR